MIASVCYIDSVKTILSCDGKSFEVIGDSPAALAMKKTSNEKESLFAKVMKDMADEFDPVNYWFTSSQNFADSNPPVEYSLEALEKMKAQMKNDLKND